MFIYCINCSIDTWQIDCRLPHSRPEMPHCPEEWLVDQSMLRATLFFEDLFKRFVWLVSHSFEYACSCPQLSYETITRLMVMFGGQLDCIFLQINWPKSRAFQVIPKYPATSGSTEVTVDISYCLRFLPVGTVKVAVCIHKEGGASMYSTNFCGGYFFHFICLLSFYDMWGQQTLISQCSAVRVCGPIWLKLW